MPTADNQIDRLLREAESLRGQQRFRDAAEIYQSILNAAPDHAQTLHQFGVMATMAGEHAMAADLIDRAVRNAGSAAIDYLPDLALAQVLSGRQEDALATFRRVIDARPDDATAHYNMGNLLNMLGDPDAAVEALQRAVALRPDFAEAHANLGATLHTAKRYEEAVAAYRRALETLPDNADLFANVGALCRSLGRFDEAADAYRRALSLAPSRLEFREKLAGALQDIGAYGEAAEHYRVVQSRASSSVDVNTGLAETLIGAGAPGEAVALCERFLATHGYNSAIVSRMAIALAEAGDREAAGRILDLGRFVRAAAVAPPPEFADLGAFNRAIELEIRGHQTLDFEPPGLSTAAGFQTGWMLDEPGTATRALAAVIRNTVRDYIEALGADPAHPFVASAPRQWTVNGWGVILQEEGHQRPHIHPRAWLSGVYYVHVPKSIGAETQDGWIEFGRPPENFGCRAEHETIRVQPQAGRMVLFPSYVYHNTIPYTDPENRISFAFDVMAA
jgi:tetratricopeptide (TPR) repeat protein